jgi:hypothetical protein
VKFLSQSLACAHATVHADELHEIHDRSTPVQFFRVFCANPFNTASTSTGGKLAAELDAEGLKLVAAGPLTEVEGAAAADEVFCVTAG